ncbi:MAG: carboxypeptidase-like regulatory domain-containing protein [Saprospiraceae bacterium]|nr:carboxypeptidase-like regulatory domain-containing protein [Saprospiraceae bacterium]
MTKTKYACSQASLYAICILAWQICRDNQAAFFAFDAQYTEGYIDDNVAAVKAAETMPDAKARQEELSLLSIEYDKVANLLAAQAKYLRSYIERAYTDKAVQKIMLQSAGFDYFSKVQNLDDKAITPFMSSALKFIADKAAVLTTDGRMPTDFAAKFNATDAAFDDVLAQYNATQSATKIKTEEKIKANNDIYDRVQAMLYDGRFMHLENPALAQVYNFNTLWDQVEPTKNAGVSGKTLAVGGKKSVPKVTVTEPLTGKTAVSDKDGSYSLLLTEGKWLLTFTADGYVSQTIEVTIQKGVTKRLYVEMVKVV